MEPVRLRDGRAHPLAASPPAALPSPAAAAALPEETRAPEERAVPGTTVVRGKGSSAAAVGRGTAPRKGQVVVRERWLQASSKPDVGCSGRGQQ